METTHNTQNTQFEMPADAQDTLVYGKNAVTELLKSGTGVDTVLLADTMAAPVAGYYTALAKEVGAVIKRVPVTKLKQLCAGADHQGVAAWASRIAYAELSEIVAAAREKGEAPFLVLCDGVEDPHNLGAILRSALLCGAHGVVIPRRGGVGVTATVLKSSAGAAARLPVARVPNMAEAIRWLKAQNVFVYCADMGGAPLAKTNLSGAVALVLGNEGSGVSALVRKLCDGAVSLEMAATNTGVDSFNVSVAAGILLYDVMRRRQTS
ncbi:MAG: 23S rRNA (guanosine(2251)-2'-O)-methyltransferase RlmB [Gemmiger sp.]|nr:23S rRNA (guanosine(2251)-2'-O)-methyltransferase RlmB [Gemmiger sp.]